MTDPKKPSEVDPVAKTARERADVLRGLAAGIFRGLHEEAALIAGAEALETQGKPSTKVLAEAWAVLTNSRELIADRYEFCYDDAPLLFSNEGDARSEQGMEDTVIQVQVVEVTK